MALSLPDLDCANKSGWLSMGGAGSSLVLYSSTLFDDSYEIVVAEVGGADCPDSPMAADDDGVRIGVSISTDMAEFVEIGECMGSCTLDIPLLP